MAGNLKFYSRAKKYVPLRRFKGNTRYFKKKTEIARDLIAKDVEDIKKLGVKKRIIVCTDCGYTSEKMVVFLRVRRPIVSLLAPKSYSLIHLLHHL